MLFEKRRYCNVSDSIHPSIQSNFISSVAEYGILKVIQEHIPAFKFCQKDNYHGRKQISAPEHTSLHKTKADEQAGKRTV